MNIERGKAIVLGLVISLFTIWRWSQSANGGVVRVILLGAGISIGGLAMLLRPVTGSLERAVTIMKAITAILAITGISIGSIYGVLGVTVHTVVFLAIGLAALAALLMEWPWNWYRRYVREQKEAL